MRTWVLGALLTALLVSGCHNGSSQHPEFDLATLQPLNFKDSKASFVVGGIGGSKTSTELPIDVKGTRTGNDLLLQLLVQGQEIEDELYRLNGNEFDLVRVSGDEFAPALPLLKFPLTVGNTWSWGGTVKSGEISHKAAGVVTTSTGKIMVESHWQDSVKVTVALELESGSSTPAKRELNFEFLPGQGPIRRDYGAGTSRVPPGQPSDTPPSAPAAPVPMAKGK